MAGGVIDFDARPVDDDTALKAATLILNTCCENPCHTCPLSYYEDGVTHCTVSDSPSRWVDEEWKKAAPTPIRKAASCIKAYCKNQGKQYHNCLNCVFWDKRYCDIDQFGPFMWDNIPDMEEDNEQ